MAMNESNQNRGEDGRFVSQTPQDDAATSPQATTVLDADSKSNSRENAPAANATETDPYEVAAKDFGGIIPGENQSDSVVSDPAQQKPVADDPQTVQKTGREQTPPPSPPNKAAEAVKSYTDMSLNTYTLLKSVPGSLVTPDEWAEMDQTERYDHVAQVKQIRADEKRKFNERQQQTANPPVAPTPARSTDLRPPQPQGNQGAGVPAESQAEIDALIDEYGEESPVVKLAVKTAKLEAALAQRDAESNQQAQRAEQERNARVVEDQIFDQLEAKYPALSDPKKRDGVRQACRDWFGIELGRDANADPFKVIERTVHRELFSDTQQAQSERDKSRSSQIRSGSFTKGAPNAPRSDAMPESSDAYAQVAAAINSAHAEGLSGSEAVNRANKIARGMAQK
mgnify:CR=1 FL=1